MKRAMSRDSENVRSHPIKPVTASACACREPDALDPLLERSLCVWSASGSSTSSACVLRTLLSLTEPDLECLPCGHQPLRLTVKVMAGASELSALGQFANDRIKLEKGILRDVLSGKISSSRPSPPFLETRGFKYHLLVTEDVVNSWIWFGMPQQLPTPHTLRTADTTLMKLQNRWR